MIDAKGGVECRIAEPGAFRIEQHRRGLPAPGNENVLGADIPMNQGKLGGRRTTQHRKNGFSHGRMPRRRVPQVGIEPQRVDKVVGRKGRGDLPV